MNNPTGVSRRIQQCIDRFRVKDFEGSLMHLFPAINKTATKRRPKGGGTGAIVKSFLRDETSLISAVATGNIIKVTVDGVGLADALYKFGRNPLAHEGELDPRLKFDDVNMMVCSDGWTLPTGYIFGMALSVIVAPENLGEELADNLVFTLYDREFDINEIWGRPESIRAHICDFFDDPNVFV